MLIPENQTFTSSLQNLVILNGISVYLNCFSNNSLTTKWFYSPFPHYAGLNLNWSYSNSTNLMNSTQTNKYLIDTLNSLTIFNVSQKSDEGYYACGSLSGTSFIGSIVYFLFVARKFLKFFKLRIY